MLGRTARAWLASAVPAVVVRLESVQGSVPRESGTTMLVSASEVAGTIGGGHLEWDACAKARILLREHGLQSGETQVQRYALGPSLGQCCGGALELSFTLLREASLPSLEQQDRALFTLWLFGAGHVGQALVSVLSTLRCDVIWIDEREEAFPLQIPLRTRRVAVDAPEAEVALAAPGDFYLVMTHQHALDLRIIEQVVRRGDAGFIGLIGSKTKRASFSSQLERKGLSMNSVQCPIAPNTAPLDDALRKEPGVIALAIAQELLAQSQT